MKNLLIVPTRNRPKSVSEFYQEFDKNTSSTTTLCFAVDSDDNSSYDKDSMPRALWEINERMGMAATLNHVANKYCQDYDYITFMGDDHRIRTKDWDLELTKDGVVNLVAYGNDLLQGPNLPTAVLMDSRIIKILGYMSPPVLKHMYLDNFWKALGHTLQTLVYRNDVIIEHMHYSVNKSEVDETYQECNDPSVYSHDGKMYNMYMSTDFVDDIKRLM